MAHRRPGYRFDDDWSENKLKDTFREIKSAVTIPVHVAIEGKQRVLDLGRAEKLLREAKLIVVSDCGCRMEHRNCSAPLDVCISLDDEAEGMLKSGKYNVRGATPEEALDALRRAHDAGLVSMAYTLMGSDKISPICNCCSCCCHTLSGLVRFGLAKHVLTSDFISETDLDLCTDCDVCADRCQFGARKMVNGKLAFDEEKCFGCGLCVTKCPTAAIRLASRH